jgi:hypothetical protein
MARIRKKKMKDEPTTERVVELLKVINDKVSSTLNTKFTIVSKTPKEDIERVQNRKVMDVEEYEVSGMLGDYKAWKGSTEAEYFYIVFMKGVVTVILEEREMLIGKNVISYAILTKLFNLANKPNSVESFDEYNETSYKEDLKSVTFQDIMVSLKWKFYSDKVKIKEGMVFLT